MPVLAVNRIEVDEADVAVRYRFHLDGRQAGDLGVVVHEVVALGADGRLYLCQPIGRKRDQRRIDRDRSAVVADGVGGVDEQVDEYLLHLVRVHRHFRQRGVEIRIELDVLEQELRCDDLYCALEDPVEIRVLLAGHGRAGEIEQALDDFPAP